MAGKKRWKDKYAPDEARAQICASKELSEVLGTPVGLPRGPWGNPDKMQAHGWNPGIAHAYLWSKHVHREVDSRPWRVAARRSASVLQHAAGNLHGLAAQHPNLQAAFEKSAIILEDAARTCKAFASYDEKFRGREYDGAAAFRFMVLLLRREKKPNGKLLTEGEIALACIALELPEVDNRRHDQLVRGIRKILLADSEP